MVRDRNSIIGSLTTELDLSKYEAELYLDSLKLKAIKGEAIPKDLRLKEAVNSLLAKGMIIKAANKGDYLPVHPRLALSNLFRIYEEKLARLRKEKRTMVDKLALEIIPLYEGSKSPNLSRRGDKRA
jgi:hypothetical protein